MSAAQVANNANTLRGSRSNQPGIARGEVADGAVRSRSSSGSASALAVEVFLEALQQAVVDARTIAALR
jgi:hypothetical protein